MSDSSTGLWGNPTPEQSPSASVEATTPLLAKGDADKFPPSKNIRWGIIDFFVSIGVMLIIQAIFFGLLMFNWMKNNAENGVDLEDTDAMLEALIAYTTQGPILLISNLLMYASWFGALWYASRKRGFGSFAKDFWLKFKWRRDILLGLAIAVGMRLAEFGVLTILDASGVDMSGSDNASIIVGMEGIWYFVNAILIASMIGPFMEEFLFRGLLLLGFLKIFRAARPKVGDTSIDFTPITEATGIPMGNGVKLGNILEKIVAPFYKYRNVLAVLLSSLFFGLMHFQGTETFGQWFVVGWTGLLGIVLAVVVLKTKRLGTAIFAHMFFNLSGVLLATFM